MISFRDPKTGKTLSVGTVRIADATHTAYAGTLHTPSGAILWTCDHAHAHQQGIEDSALQCAKTHLKQMATA